MPAAYIVCVCEFPAMAINQAARVSACWRFAIGVRASPAMQMHYFQLYFLRVSPDACCALLTAAIVMTLNSPSLARWQVRMRCSDKIWHCWKHVVIVVVLPGCEVHLRCCTPSPIMMYVCCPRGNLVVLLFVPDWTCALSGCSNNYGG